MNKLGYIRQHGDSKQEFPVRNSDTLRLSLRDVVSKLRMNTTHPHLHGGVGTLHGRGFKTTISIAETTSLAGSLRSNVSPKCLCKLWPTMAWRMKHSRNVICGNVWHNSYGFGKMGIDRWPVWSSPVTAHARTWNCGETLFFLFVLFYFLVAWTADL